MKLSYEGILSLISFFMRHPVGYLILLSENITRRKASKSEYFVCNALAVKKHYIRIKQIQPNPLTREEYHLHFHIIHSNLQIISIV